MRRHQNVADGSSFMPSGTPDWCGYCLEGYIDVGGNCAVAKAASSSGVVRAGNGLLEPPSPAPRPLGELAIPLFVAGSGREFAFLLEERTYVIPSAVSPTVTRPPITPPMIAPVGVLLGLLLSPTLGVLAGEGSGVVVEVVVPRVVTDGWEVTREAERVVDGVDGGVKIARESE
jgi:hypothetical protein